MPTPSLPYIIPNSVEFNIQNESSLTQTVCIYNPYAYEILFKVDNAWPQKYVVSNRQGLISSRQKLPLEISCRAHDLSQTDQVQVRFFKWPRPRYGQKPRAQQYIGFRELGLIVVDYRALRDRTPSQCSDRLTALASSPPPTHHDLISSSPPKPGSIDSSYSSRPTWNRRDSDSSSQQRHDDGQKFHVVSNLIIIAVLLLMGFLLNQANEDWFSLNVMNGIKPQTLAIVAYTLACVVTIKLLTLR